MTTLRSDDHDIELYRPPAFQPGEKVFSRKYIRNDGTVPGSDIGAIVVAKGEVGYVRDIGTFLNQFYVYAVEFVDRRAIVGMRRDELVSLDKETAP